MPEPKPPQGTRRALLTAGVVVCCVLPVAGQHPMEVTQNQYELRAGETIQIAAPQETLDFLKNAKTRRVEIVTGETASGGLVAAPNRAGDQVLLGASLRMNPGVYSAKLSASSAAGEERETTLSVVVNPRVSVPTGATRNPVVLLNGWETGFTTGCPVASGASDDFGNLASYLVTDGVPVVYLFDNCLEDPGQSIETLGNDLSAFLDSIKYDNGTQVPQIDLVGFSIGGLIARSYLAGLQPTEILTPPTSTLVGKLVLIATPNFGSFVAGNYGSILAATSQSAELEPGSGFLWNLATWNQRSDDLRGVDAIAVIGNAGNYTPSASSAVANTNASDGLVSLTSASLGFVAQQTEVTRIVPYCHVDPATFTTTIFGVYACNAPGIANVSSTTHYTGLIVRSFLAGTTDWQSIGTTPATDPYLSKYGAIFFALVNAAGNYATDLTSVSFGTVPLVNGTVSGTTFGSLGTIFYVDFIAGTGILEATSTSLGSYNLGTFPAPVGYTSTPRTKLATVIISVGPLTGNSGKTVAAGSTITIAGNVFGSKCNGCKVVATPTTSTTGDVLTTTSWSNTSITATLPAGLTGLITLQVIAAAGSDSIAVMVIPQATLAVTPSSLQFAYTVGGATPAAESIQITNSGSGTLSWSATTSATWLTLSPASGTAPSTLSVSISTAGLSAGTYTGTIAIAATGASNTPASISVTLTVTPPAPPPPSLAVGPQTLSFQYTNGGSVPAAQNVAITNAGGGTLTWTASTSAYWLGVSAASGGAPATLVISVNPVNLAAGTYTGTVTITAAGVTGSPAPVAVTLVVSGTQPAPTVTGVTSAASFQPGIASASWVSIFGTSLSQSTYVWQAGDFVNGLLPTSLQGVSVMINGVAAYVEYISPTLINVLAPDDPTTGTVQVQVTAAQQTSNSFSAQKNQFAPAFFTIDNGLYVAALHAAGYGIVGAPNLLSGVVTTPATPGETIVLYGTGFGATNPPLPTAQLVTTAEPLPNLPKITIGGQAATVGFGGLVGPGLYQFNVTVPSLPSGGAAVVATINDVATQSGVSVTIQQ